MVLSVDCSFLFFFMRDCAAEFTFIVKNDNFFALYLEFLYLLLAGTACLSV